MPRPSIAVPVLTAVSALVLAACGGSSSAGSDAVSPGSAGSPAASHVTLTLYNGQHEQTTQALVKAFEAQTGDTVKIRSDDETVLDTQIKTEGSASPADVFFTENSPPLEDLQQHGLLAPIDASTLAKVPAQYSSPQGDWLGVSKRVSLMVYNTDDLTKSQLPTSVMDLAQPQWKGKLAIAPGETDFQPIVTSIAAAHGQAAALKWLQAIKANGASHSYPDNETLVAKVNSGAAQIGVINHYYWYRLRDSVGRSGMHSALAFFAPHDVGYLIDVSGVGVLKSSQHLAAAQQLAAFLVGHTAGHIIATSDSWEYPAATGEPANPGLPPFASLQPDSVSVAQLGNGALAVQLLQQAQLL